MQKQTEEPIDLSRLSQRELLILCARDIQELKKDFADMKTEQNKMKEDLITSKAHNKVWGSVIGFMSGFLSGLIPSAIK